LNSSSLSNINDQRPASHSTEFALRRAVTGAGWQHGDDENLGKTLKNLAAIKQTVLGKKVVVRAAVEGLISDQKA
jgi:hypothetical protein